MTPLYSIWRKAKNKSVPGCRGRSPAASCQQPSYNQRMADARPKTKRPKMGVNYEETDRARLVDDIAEFEEFKASLLPVLRADLRKGTPAKDILEKLQALSAARLGHIVMTEKDSAKAMSAIKDILDRTGGKAKETVETTHKFSKLKDAELDALLKSRIEEAQNDDDTSDTH